MIFVISGFCVIKVSNIGGIVVMIELILGM